MELNKIKRLGRDTQGVTLMRLKDNDKVSSVAIIIPDENKPENKETPKDKHEELKIGEIENSKGHTKEVETKKMDSDFKDKPIRVHFYEKEGSENLKETEIEKTSEKFHIKSYKNETEIKETSQEETKDDTPKNPPIQKDTVNYWGGNKHK